MSETPAPRRAGDRAAVRALAAGALVLGALAPLAGSPYRAAHAEVDVRGLAREVEEERDHVSALELGRWIRDRHPGLRVLDLRPDSEYAASHVPSAERLTLGELAGARFAPHETLVLYSEGGTHAAQAWVLLRALGHERVYFLRGGLFEWIEQVMEPTVRSDATAEERAAFDRAASLSRYFGGTPRVRDDASAAEERALPAHRHEGAPSTRVQRVKRRSC